jgi:hypothetical protein
MSNLEQLKVKLADIESVREDEDYPGQFDELRRNIIVQFAASAADEIIMEGSNGSAEETDYLTSAVAQIMNNRVHQRNVMALMKWDLFQRKP